MDKWSKLASKESVDKTIQALKVNGINARFVETAEEAKKEVFSLLPESAEVIYFPK